jgi:hypothetical protein
MKKQSKKEKLSYKEGTWFAIPLRQGGYAAGRVARHSPKGEIILAYYFGPKRETIPTLDELDKLTPNSAIRVAKVGALGIIEGSWPIIGDSPKWEREKWPMPDFIRRDDIGKVAWRVVYADDNPNQVIAEQRIPYDSSGYESDGLDGAGAAEIIITKMLS